MNPNEYQKLASRTSSLKEDINSEAIDHRNRQRVLMACLGLAGETGESIDYLKKVVYHNHALDKEKLKRELGDILWYIAEMCSAFDIKMDELFELNISKLKHRYPEGFSSEASINRHSDKVEKYCQLCGGNTDAVCRLIYIRPLKDEFSLRTTYLGTIDDLKFKEGNEGFDKIVISVNICEHHYDLNRFRISDKHYQSTVSKL